jgi:hypothetical protein
MTLQTQLSGKVLTVNGSAGYVILSFPVGHLPALEQRLDVYHLGLKCGELRVSGPQMDDTTVADLMSGEASAGDEARAK